MEKNTEGFEMADTLTAQRKGDTLQWQLSTCLMNSSSDEQQERNEENV